MRCQRSALGFVTVGVLMLALLSGAVATPNVRGRVSVERETRATAPVATAGMSVPNPSHPQRSGAATRAAHTFRKAPLSFEANQGQTDPSVKFLARGAGYQLYLTPTEAVLSLTKEARGDKNKQKAKYFRSVANATR